MVYNLSQGARGTQWNSESNYLLVDIPEGRRRIRRVSGDVNVQPYMNGV